MQDIGILNYGSVEDNPNPEEESGLDAAVGTNDRAPDNNVVSGTGNIQNGAVDNREPCIDGMDIEFRIKNFGDIDDVRFLYQVRTCCNAFVLDANMFPIFYHRELLNLIRSVATRIKAR